MRLTRRLTLLVCALLLLGSSCTIMVTPRTFGAITALLNGGFEYGSSSASDNPAGWNRTSSTPNNVFLTWDNAYAHSGHKSVKITLSAPGDARWIQMVSVQTHTIYRLSGWVKTSNVAHTGDTSDVGAHIGVLGSLFHSSPVVGTHDWTYITFDFDTGPATQVTLAARLGFPSGTTSGTAWFDDLSLTVLTLKLQPINLLANPDAEDGVYPSSSMPPAWRTDADFAEGVSFSWDAGQAHSGSKSVRISAQTPNDARWLQRVAVQPHTAYRLSGWIKTRDVGHSNQSRYAGANIGLYGSWNRSQTIMGTHDWTPVSLDFDSADTTQITIAVRLGFWSVPTTGSAWFDDLSLEPSNGTPLIANAGFEQGTYVTHGLPNAWTAHALSHTNATFTWDDDTHQTGTKSMHIQLATPGTADWRQTVSVQSHTDYNLSGWIKTTHVASRSANTGDGAYLAVDEVGAFSQSLLGSHEWQRVTMTFHTGAISQITVAGRLGRANGATGSAWFDSFQLAPVNPANTPRWRVLLLIYHTTDVSYTDSSGVQRHVVAKLSKEQQQRAAASASRFFAADVPALTSGTMYPSLSIRYPRRPLTRLAPFGSAWWPAPEMIDPERDGLFDSVIVIWSTVGIDQATGEQISLAGASGLALATGTSQTYAAINGEVTSYDQRNIFKHEWGHSVLFYYDAAGVAPKPTVDTDLVQEYTHWPTGTPYIHVDECDAALIPNSIYNDTMGFTHDYYSGTTATRNDPDRCLGIPLAAWATGGPTWNGSMVPLLFSNESSVVTTQP